MSSSCVRSDLPRVTEILRGAGLVDSSWFTDEARDRGTAVHQACQYLAERALDWDSLHGSIRGRVSSFNAFLSEMRPEILATEERVESLSHGYRGTPDLRLRLDGREGVADLKPPTEAPWHAIQLAAYAGAYDRPMKRWNIYLADTGRYRIVERKSREDWKVFLAALTIHNWRGRNGQPDDSNA